MGFFFISTSTKPASATLTPTSHRLPYMRAGISVANINVDPTHIILNSNRYLGFLSIAAPQMILLTTPTMMKIPPISEINVGEYPRKSDSK